MEHKNCLSISIGKQKLLPIGVYDHFCFFAHKITLNILYLALVFENKKQKQVLHMTTLLVDVFSSLSTDSNH